MVILALYANFGGASHDSYIWNNSQVKIYLENHLNLGEQTWLIGDSGYPQSRVLMTPFLDALNGTPEARYNNAHMRARNVVERAIGVLKMRFRCILKERSARYDPHFVCKIIKSCSVLHNMCINNNIPLPNDRVIVEDGEPPRDIFIDNRRVGNEGILVRHRLVQRYFR